MREHERVDKTAALQGIVDEESTHVRVVLDDAVQEVIIRHPEHGHLMQHGPPDGTATTSEPT